MAQVQGKIVQCIGAVVDVEFPRDKMPKIYDALKKLVLDGRGPLGSDGESARGDGEHDSGDDHRARETELRHADLA